MITLTWRKRCYILSFDSDFRVASSSSSWRSETKWNVNSYDSDDGGLQELELLSVSSQGWLSYFLGKSGATHKDHKWVKPDHTGQWYADLVSSFLFVNLKHSWDNNGTLQEALQSWWIIVVKKDTNMMPLFPRTLDEYLCKVLIVSVLKQRSYYGLKMVPLDYPQTSRVAIKGVDGSFWKKKNQIKFVLTYKDNNWRHRVYPDYFQTKFGSVLVFVCLTSSFYAVCEQRILTCER